ncbi:DUF1740-domain-containing protein [Corynespora cassiicola Philippines]|uniref:DUF1740-domain-containing protein n=1 Tax=Corynespora cassiicola Philippines TaxID=1448308 RepID=A0A2T2PA99_CORCC|nr:DUF1740-domain-containing protein [Corynespora cassiicola Philippines]
MGDKVPKFGSFKPPPKEPPKEPPPRPRSPQREQRADKSRHSDRSSRHELPHRSEKKPAKEKGRSRSPTRRSKSPDQPKTYSNVFFVDRRGDPDNLKYGGINRYDIPDYRRIGYGSILGASPDVKIDRKLSTDREIYTTTADSSYSRYQRLLTGKKSVSEDEKALRVVKQKKIESELGQDFIALSAAGDQRRQREDEEYQGVDYRGITRAYTERQDPDLNYDTDSDVDKADSEVTQRNAVLMRRTVENPTDLQAWLELVEHQEAMLKLDRPSHELSYNEIMSLAKIRISIYQKAIDRIGADVHSQIMLSLGLMDEATKAWDKSKQKDKWAGLLKKYPQSVELWLKYLGFEQTNLKTFKYDDCVELFMRCLQEIQAAPEAARDGDCLHVMIRLTTMIRQSGYQELSIGIWQALVEFNAFKPISTQGNEEELVSFENFWRSETARVGEANARGWKHFHSSNFSIPTPVPALDDGQNSTDNIYDDFANREVRAMETLRYPGRVEDKLGENDCFHGIFFPDVERQVRAFRRHLSSTDVLEAFLCFCGLPPLPRAGINQPKWQHDPFLQDYLDIAPAISTGPDTFINTLSQLSNCPMRHFCVTVEHLCDGGFPDTLRITDTAFVRRVLELLAAEGDSDELIGEYLLAFELKYYPSEVHKTARRILQTRTSSLRLYNAYGLVESRRGNSTKADKTFSSALSFFNGSEPYLSIEQLMLFSGWVWEALRRGEKDKALWRLTSPGGRQDPASNEGQGIPGKTSLLRIQRALQDSKDHGLANQLYHSAILCTSLQALLVYLSGHGPDKAIAVHMNLQNWLERHKMAQSTYAELHAQAIAQFLTYYATSAPIVKPVLLRTVLEPLVIKFPNNTILLSLFAANEARFAIDGRVRHVVQKVILNSKEAGIFSWTFAIHYETLRGEIAGSTTHSIRALYKKTLYGIGAHCPALRRGLVLFELEETRKAKSKKQIKATRDYKGNRMTHLEEARARVKNAFVTGLPLPPWNKEYLMLAFTHLKSGILSDDDLMTIYQVMLENDLRLTEELNVPPTDQLEALIL